MRYGKLIFATLLAFLTGLSSALVGPGDTVTANEWITIALGTVVAAGGVYGITSKEPTRGPTLPPPPAGGRTQP